jgi:hypothetical protein
MLRLKWLSKSGTPYLQDPRFINEVGPNAKFWTVITVGTGGDCWPRHSMSIKLKTHGFTIRSMTCGH